MKLFLMNNNIKCKLFQVFIHIKINLKVKSYEMNLSKLVYIVTKIFYSFLIQ